MRVQRISEMKKYIINNKSVSLQDLCEIFDVSLNTIRRDIDQLEKENIISKVYGGVIINDDSDVVPHSHRVVSNREAKESICKIASTLLSERCTIYIDSGTTTVPLLKYIKPEMKITIISNSLDIFNEAAKYPKLIIISVGGLLSYPTNSFIGIPAINTLSHYKIDKAFMGTTALSVLNGATNNSYHESEIKRAVISKSNEVILLADSSKIDQTASLSFCSFEDIDVFVTDEKPNNALISAAEKLDVNCIYKQ
jgi:DeoR family transcriptional regulator, myo-inositol catabolism operon repressor